jgi:hypothetical protein
MMTTSSNYEPIVTLPTGQVVFACVFESLWRLQASGHTVTVCGIDEVDVQPSGAITDDWLIVLGRNVDEVSAILALDHGAIH